MAAIDSLDQNMAVAEVRDGLEWYDVSHFDVEGRGWAEVDRFYSRLPARAKGVVRPAVWELAQQSAGICARFVTDATSISARWTLFVGNLAMNHMPATGMSGLDLYVRHAGAWRWIGVGRPTKLPTNQHQMVADMPPGTREYQLYLPLYNGVDQVQIGLPPGASLRPAPPREGTRRRPIVFYGTSIVQGGCASRPGMAHVAILGRRLEWPVINLGFSGNGQMEPEVIELLAELDPAAYVIDCLPNVEELRVTERLEPLVRALRAAHPDTPMVLVENIVYQNGFLVGPRFRRYTTSNAAHRVAVARLVTGGVGGLHIVPCHYLLGQDGEATVDGTHPTDVGFIRLADAIEPVLREALAAAKRKGTLDI